MGCYKLTYDYQPTLFLQEQGEKIYTPDWRVTVNAGSKLGGEGAKVLTQSSVSFVYRIIYDNGNDRPYPPTKDNDLGRTLINRKGSSFTKNASGGYDVTIAITILLNKALQHGSDFLTRNPDLDYDVLAHELGHGFMVETEAGKMNIPGLLLNSGYEGEEQDKYFQRVLLGLKYQAFGYDEQHVDQYKFQFLPPDYVNSRTPIKW